MDVSGDDQDNVIESEIETDAYANLAVSNAVNVPILISDGLDYPEPFVGMEFDSLESARSFYTHYGRRFGFEIRIACSHRSRRDKQITAQQYVCGKENFLYDNVLANKNTRANGRMSCNALMSVKRVGSGQWVVKQFEKEHNHEVMCLNELHPGIAVDRNVETPAVADIHSTGASPMDTTAFKFRERMDVDSQVLDDSDVEDKFDGHDSFITKRDSNLEPYVGMVFESEVEARAYYNAYARHFGFGTRINYSHRSRRDRSMIAQQYVCDKEGFRLNKEGSKKRHRMDTRVGCKALLNVRKVSNGIWIVKTFVKEHNHPLVNQFQVQHFRSHRGTPDVPRSRITNLQKGESQAVVNFLKNVQYDNPSFFYAIQVDDDGRMINAFWIDAISRANYTFFGDTVTFDTSYLVKKFGISFAPFMGRNHHNQPVLFGCALLTDESESSFTWLFRTWLYAMSGCPPISIVTDPDRALCTAVSDVFSESEHRFSLWNIETNLAEKLGSICRTHKNFREEFQKCVYESSNVAEFESAWESFIEKFDVKSNEWLGYLYDNRKYWSPVHSEKVFYSEMPCNRPNEYISSFLDEYVSPGATVEEFFLQYENALNNLHHKEVEADYESACSTPNMKTSSPMEKQAASIYTKEIFKQFQVELFECFGYFAKKVSENEGIKIYNVAKFGEDKSCHIVEFDISEMKGSCSCRMFEYMGILCRHVLNVFRVSNLFVLPHHYILKRWTRNAKSRALLDESGGEVPEFCNESMTLRFSDICRRAMKIAEEGSRTTEGYRMAVWGLQEALEQVMTLN